MLAAIAMPAETAMIEMVVPAAHSSQNRVGVEKSLQAGPPLPAREKSMPETKTCHNHDDDSILADGRAFRKKTWKIAAKKTDRNERTARDCNQFNKREVKNTLFFNSVEINFYLCSPLSHPSSDATEIAVTFHLQQLDKCMQRKERYYCRYLET